MKNLIREVGKIMIGVGGAALAISYPVILMNYYQSNQENPSAYHASLGTPRESREESLEVSEPFYGGLLINLPEDRGLDRINLPEDRGLSGIEVPIVPI